MGPLKSSVRGGGPPGLGAHKSPEFGGVPPGLEPLNDVLNG